MIPEAIGRYRVLRRVGAGGMGVVYEAIDDGSNTRVALKVLLPHAAEQVDGLLRFKREFRALARLRHPNIVRVFDAGIEDNMPFIAMEFVEGRDIRRHSRAIPEGPVREKELRRCVREIFGALAHVHARRIVHRDLKPENIMVCHDGSIKLMDFGVARLRRAEHDGPGLLGTFAYMSPEQVVGGELDARADLYAVGVLIYEILVGEYPFAVEPPAAALHHHVHTVPDRISVHRPSVDPRLENLAARLLAKDPLDRPPSAEAAHALLGPEAADLRATRPELTTAGILFSPRLVGRPSELAQLRAFVAELQEGRGRMLEIEGPSGIGKTRLVDELLGSLRDEQYVLRGRCSPDNAQAYDALEGLIDEVAGIVEKAAPEVATRILGPDAGLLAPISRRLARLVRGPVPSLVDARHRQVALRKAIVGLIGRLALHRPAVILLEDIHWADEATLEVLRDCSRTLFAPRPGGEDRQTVSPVLFVLTRRSLSEGFDPAGALAQRLEAKGRLERIRLRPLDRSGVTRMLETMTGESSPIPEVVDELQRASGGRPALVREMLEAWVDEELLQKRAGRWCFRGTALTRASSPPGGVVPIPEHPAASASSPSRGRRPRPPRAEELALAKLSSASSSTRELVERLALLGPMVPGSLAFTAVGMSEEVFLLAVDEAVRTRLLVEESQETSVRYRFAEGSVREAVVRALPSVRRRALHEDLAVRLERRFIRRKTPVESASPALPLRTSREVAHVLARHFRCGSQPIRAVRYLLVAAQEAARRGDLEVARRRVVEAAEIIAGTPPSVARGTRLVRVRCQEVELLLDFDQAETALERADLSLVTEARSPAVSEAEMRLRRAEAFFLLGKLGQVVSCLNRIPRPFPHQSLGARVLALMGRARLEQGEVGAARDAFRRALVLAEAVGLESLAERLLAYQGLVTFDRRELQNVRARLDRSLERARARGDDRTVVELLGHAGLVELRRGRSPEAQSALRSAMELAKIRGFRRALERWTGQMGLLLSELRDVVGARQSFRAAFDLASSSADEGRAARWAIELCALDLGRSAVESVRSRLQQVLATAQALGDGALESRACLRLAHADRLEGRFDSARAYAERALRLAEAGGHAGLEVSSYLEQSLLSRDAERDLALDSAERRADAIEDLQLLEVVGRARMELTGRSDEERRKREVQEDTEPG